MTYRDILRKVDHTVLKQTTTWADIQKLCDEASKYSTASICIPPAYIAQAAEYLQGKVPICTVIGFPNGSNTTATKVFEIKDAIAAGAAELDMVINIGWAKDGRFDLITEEINALKAACGDKILKVIVETCLLTEEEKVGVCEAVNNSTADFIKTSTGFSTAGATFEDVALMAKHMKPGKKIKAAGGISDFADGKKFIELGASRLGTSRLVALAKNVENLDAEA